MSPLPKGANTPAPVIDFTAMPRVLTRLNRLALNYPWHFAGALFCALCAAILGLVTPRLLGEAVNHAHQLLADVRSPFDASDARSALYSFGILIIIAASLRGGFTGLQGFLGENIAQRVGCDLRLAFFKKLQALDYSFHDVRHSGDLIARGMLDVEGVRAFLEHGVLRTITLVLLLGFGAWRLLGVDLVLGALALSFVPVVLFRAAAMGVSLRRAWLRLQQLMSDLTLRMEENLQGVRVVRAFANDSQELRRFDAISAQALEVSDERIAARVASSSQMSLAFYSAMALVLWYGGRRIMQGSLSVGTLTEFLTFMTVLQQPVRQIGMLVNASARATSAGGRLFEILDAEPAIRDADGARSLHVTEGVLRFENVAFSYGNGPEDRRILSDISFTVRPGQVLGIVGAPGSGKSTLVNLIPRFYDVSGGRITIDGQDIRDVTLESLRRQISLVQQDVFLFDASVHENLAYTDPLADEERVREAAELAQIHEYVANLPAGYQTRVGERGVALSGGQRQRLSIARGVVSNPRFLIMDDATAAIDSVTEARVRQNLRKDAQVRAVIVIAHRLSSVKDADEILVLDDGRITERGSHQQLLARGGAYTTLWHLQFSTAQTSSEAGSDRQP